MSGSDREALPNVQEWSEAIRDVREWSGGSHGCNGVVGSPSRMSGSGQHILPDVREWSGGHPGCAGVAGNSWEALPEVWEWSGGLTGSPGVVESPSQMCGSGLEALPDNRERTESPP